MTLRHFLKTVLCFPWASKAIPIGDSNGWRSRANAMIDAINKPWIFDLPDPSMPIRGDTMLPVSINPPNTLLATLRLDTTAFSLELDRIMQRAVAFHDSTTIHPFDGRGLS